MAGDRAKTERLEHLTQRFRIGCGVLDELEAVRPIGLSQRSAMCASCEVNSQLDSGQ
jgi:hypothetical protein